MPEKKKIAVLGGGPAALSAVYWLTSTPELRAKYQITLYQMGWRLGGKGASGRGRDGRIIEHGLHILFGFYQNFFFMMRHAYAEIARPEGHPLRTWRQAFHPGGIGVEEEYVQGAWDPWIIPFPGNSGVPGSGGALPTIWQYLMMFAQGFVSLIFGWERGYALTQRWFPRGRKWEQAPDPALGGKEPWGTLLMFRIGYGVLTLMTWVIWCVRRYTPWLAAAYTGMRKTLWQALLKRAKKSRRAHRLWLDLDAILTILRGIIVDGLLRPGGFDRVDDVDFRVWLLRHGLHRETLGTTLVRTIYDAAFSYENGDPNRQSVSAGATVKILLRWAATFKGAAYYKMQAGMGDTVFTPLYQVLKERGVAFRFFHKVDALHLSGDGKSIASISMHRQAELKDDGEYDPLTIIQGLECWPADPLYDQISDADKLRDIDLESYYSGHQGAPVTVEAGTDFDEVLFGIPIGAVQFVCAELVENDATPAWREMVDHVKSVQTVAAQLWMDKDLKQLGWPTPSPLLSLFVEPFNTWADMSQVKDREDWPQGHEPRNISYFTGAQPGPTDPAHPSDTGFQKQMDAAAYNSFVTFLKGGSHNPDRDPAIGGLTTLWPGAADPFDPRVLDWNRLVDTQDQTGEARLTSQYCHSNCGPSERCTLSLPGTNRYRIKAGETGYDNLTITGDWTDNNLYLAFMEASFQAGILSARAIADEDFPIIGEWLNGTDDAKHRPRLF
jgi:uncharacterized protein with NAD-binding domain and iron-sulfur cluster